MSIKNSHTTSDFIEWDKMLILVQKLQKTDAKIALLVQVASFSGLRVSDILKLKWNDVLNKDFIELTEKKTSKYRKIKINDALKTALNVYYQNNKPVNDDQFVFVNRFNAKPISVQYVNRKLKNIKTDNKLKIGNFSMHSFRKCFGRKIVESSEYKEKSLIILSELFNHSSSSITRKYLGLRESELMSVYDLL
jgi:integrase